MDSIYGYNVRIEKIHNYIHAYIIDNNEEYFISAKSMDDLNKLIKLFRDNPHFYETYKKYIKVVKNKNTKLIKELRDNIDQIVNDKYLQEDFIIRMLMAIMLTDERLKAMHDSKLEIEMIAIGFRKINDIYFKKLDDVLILIKKENNTYQIILYYDNKYRLIMTKSPLVVYKVLKVIRERETNKLKSMGIEVDEKNEIIKGIIPIKDALL